MYWTDSKTLSPPCLPGDPAPFLKVSPWVPHSLGTAWMGSNTLTLASSLYRCAPAELCCLPACRLPVKGNEQGIKGVIKAAIQGWLAGGNVLYFEQSNPPPLCRSQRGTHQGDLSSSCLQTPHQHDVWGASKTGIQGWWECTSHPALPPPSKGSSTGHKQATSADFFLFMLADCQSEAVSESSGGSLKRPSRAGWLPGMSSGSLHKHVEPAWAQDATRKQKAGVVWNRSVDYVRSHFVHVSTKVSLTNKFITAINGKKPYNPIFLVMNLVAIASKASPPPHACQAQSPRLPEESLWVPHAPEPPPPPPPPTTETEWPILPSTCLGKSTK